MNRRISRRQLLKTLATAAGGIGASTILGKSLLQRKPQEQRASAWAPEDLEKTFVPVAYKGEAPPPPPTSSTVVQVRSQSATFWDFGNDYYGDFVNQNTVNAMVDRGIMELAGASSIGQAWSAIVPNYAPGKAIAIKVNFNNTWHCDKCRENCADDWALAIDALIHPINAMIRGLRQAYPSFRNQDIWVYDATEAYDNRQIPQRFKSGCLYAGVRFFDDGTCSETAGYTSADPTAGITWHNPPQVPTPPASKVTDVLVKASYVINMPIMKKHGSGGATLSFKNHFGSIANCAPLHDWVFQGSSHYAGEVYNPMVDIYRNPHVGPKTVLVVGDALFGNWENNIGKPRRWATFGNRAPNSLLFSTDPVAVDCVMTDLIGAETWLVDGAYDHLVCAAACGLGTYERGDPWGSGYSEIDYRKIEL